MAYKSVLQWFENLKGRFSAYPPYVFDMAFFGFAGLIAGVLLKNFGRVLLLSLILIGGFLWFADHFNLVVIKQLELQEFLGFDIFTTIQESATTLPRWIQEHTTAALAAAVGFFIGWKLS
jgi:uncharacterized membrane protein (Fun14 family)